VDGSNLSPERKGGPMRRKKGLSFGTNQADGFPEVKGVRGTWQGPEGRKAADLRLKEWLFLCCSRCLAVGEKP